MRTEQMTDDTYKKAISTLKADLGIDFERILEKVDQRDLTRDTDKCSVVALFDLLTGELSEQERKRVEQHLEICSKCRESMKRLKSKNPNARIRFRERLLPRLADLFQKRDKKKAECRPADGYSRS